MAFAKRVTVTNKPHWRRFIFAEIIDQCNRNLPCEKCVLWHEKKKKCVVADVLPCEWDADDIASRLRKQKAARKKEIRPVHI